MAIVALMYHAITNDRVTSLYDPHYSVSQKTFQQQIKFILSQNHLIQTIPSLLDKEEMQRNGYVCVTFDDGAATDYEVAFPILCDNDASADFFINTSTVGSNGYLDWHQIREMQQSGMSIQSHGHTHRYFDDLADDEIKQELEFSKKIIEDKTGEKVSVFAPPGGRLKPAVWRIAEELGYKIICHSKPGVWSNDAKGIPRFAVLNGTSHEQFVDWVNQNRKELFFGIASYNFKYGVKKALGNSQYEKLRNMILGEGK